MLLPRTHASPGTGRVRFVDGLSVHGAATALVEDGRTTTYAALADEVESAAAHLGTGRRLVLIATSATRACVVAYLAALRGGHVALLVGSDNPSAQELLRTNYQPDSVVSAEHGWLPQHLTEHPAHDLHPDLAVLLSTSGSTGSPKLVRLSHDNLQANADAIAGYLGLVPDDVGVTTLPLNYCYGLSVLHSHLTAGAGVLLTRTSVVDPCFWDAARDAGVTSLAGVPYTFDLLDRLGSGALDLPSLRTVTQAGGRLAPDRVTELAATGRRLGFDLFVMYGQTEATARMAYLPPHLASTRPTCVGIPVPGGQISLEPVIDPDALPSDSDADGVGELVYRGPNVMLGYARAPSDLALGRTIDELRTGDLARMTSDGLVEVVGRTGRAAKLFGLRIDMEHLQQLLGRYGYSTAVTQVGDSLVVAVEGGDDPDWVGRLAAEDAALPRHAVRAIAVEQLPRLESGKVDLPAVAALAAEVDVPVSPPPSLDDGIGTTEDVRSLFAELLERPGATLDDTFVGLGGDSLSYVSVSVELERVLGHLPDHWHVTPIRDLRPSRRRWRGIRRVETGIAVRALASIMIVATHVGLVDAAGSAHVLIALAGYNFARFQLNGSERRERVHGQVRSLLRIGVPTVIWIAAVLVLLDTPYSWLNVTLTNALLGTPTWDATWHYWFIEMLVWILVSMAVLTALPWVDRLERRAPFGVPLAVLAFGLAARFGLLPFDLFNPQPVLWLFALGWAIARASAVWHRLALTAVALTSVPGFFDDPRRDGIILAGVLLVLWVPRLPLPTLLVPLVGTLASASLYIYLTHWQVYPWVREVNPYLALVTALLVGVVYMRVAQGVTGWASRALRRPASAGRVEQAAT